MKQRITIEQLNELGDEQKELLIEQYKSMGDYTRNPLLSIGQMIELLSNRYEMPHMVKNYDTGKVYYSVNGKGYSIGYENNCIELCDALWEAVKEKL